MCVDVACCVTLDTTYLSAARSCAKTICRLTAGTKPAVGAGSDDDVLRSHMYVWVLRKSGVLSYHHRDCFFVCLFLAKIFNMSLTWALTMYLSVGSVQLHTVCASGG